MLPLLLLTACSKSDYVEPLNNEAFRLSSISDVISDNGVMSYKVVAPYTDTFLIESEDLSKISIYKDDKLRLPIIKYFKEFMEHYLEEEKPKGLYCI